MLAAIVLAAGKSDRMGRPKALLLFRGKTFLENILDVISRSPVQQTVVVTGHHRREIEEAFLQPGYAAIVFNPDYEKGMITSFQTGIRALAPEAAAAFLFLVDHPVVEAATIEALAAKAGQDRIVVPTFQGSRGHPVLFGTGILKEILELDPSQGANVVVRKDPGRVVEVPVASQGILIDVDTPEDFDRLSRSPHG